MVETPPTILVISGPQEEEPVMSFPAVLRNPNLTARYAHLLPAESSSRQVNAKGNRGGTFDAAQIREGKRRIRRRDNARFTSNPHVVTPTSKDFSILRDMPTSTFPTPVPRCLQNSLTPTTHLPSMPDLSSSKAGHFTLALKGVRKGLRRCGPRAERLVRDVEEALLSWLETGDVTMYSATGVLSEDIAPISDAFRDDGPIREIDRSPGRLLWSIPDDPFARYICHCVCRWHSVVSYSKADSDSSSRLTYILRPNPTRMNGGGGISVHLAALDTPPPTERDSASSLGSDSDIDAWSDQRSNYPPSEADEDEECKVIDGDSSLANSISEMRAGLTLPPIIQRTPLRTADETRSPPSSEDLDTTPRTLSDVTRELQALGINDKIPASPTTPNSDLDANFTPTPTPFPLRASSSSQLGWSGERARAGRTRLIPPSRSRSSHSHSPSSPYRSPASMRWRLPFPRVSSAQAASVSHSSGQGIPLPGRLARSKKGGNQPSRTLYSFIYER